MEINVIKLEVVRESTLNVNLPKNSVSSPEDVAKVFQQYIGKSDREYFAILMLDTKNHINAIHTVSIGSLNSSIVHPREVFKAAILHNSSAIVLGHNHPSTNCQPSMEDTDTTRRLVDASNILGIKILDHVIVSEISYFSFKEQGLI